jgi:Arc/MetJ-type ribon-helix-helix transcriptional regulator
MPTTTLRLPEKLSEQIDAWAHKQPDAPGHSEAIRRLVELGLKRPVNTPGRRLRAQELAAQAIEKMIDPAAPPEERAQRRRRLMKGPSEFREDRVDLPMTKGK